MVQRQGPLKLISEVLNMIESQKFSQGPLKFNSASFANIFENRKWKLKMFLDRQRNTDIPMISNINLIGAGGLEPHVVCWRIWRFVQWLLRFENSRFQNFWNSRTKISDEKTNDLKQYWAFRCRTLVLFKTNNSKQYCTDTLFTKYWFNQEIFP